MASGRRSVPVRNWLPHIVFTAAVVAVIVFAFTRNGEPEPGASTSSPASGVVSTASPETPTTADSDRVVTPSTEAPAPATSSTTGAPEQVEVLMPEVATYLEELEIMAESVADLVTDGRAANLAWDNAEETGVTFQQTEAALLDVLNRAQVLHETLGGRKVPPPLDALHQDPGGPLALAGALVASAEAMLEGLRIPVPDDGSARRAALADFIAASEEFSRAADGLAGHVREKGGELGLTVMVASSDSTLAEQPTPEGSTTTTGPEEEMRAETIAYIEVLQRLAAILPYLEADMTAAVEAWDNTEQTGVTYQETEAALVDVMDRTLSFASEVEDSPVPDGLEQLGGELVQHAQELVSAAQTVLETFRSPTNKDGSDRLDALAAFAGQAMNFAKAVDGIISYVDENAELSGLADNG